MRCKKCGSEDLTVVESGPHKKLVCNQCLGFQKFLNHSEYKTFLQIYRQMPKKEEESGGTSKD